MENPKRRDFLRQSAGILGAFSGLSVMPAVIRRALAVEAQVETGTLQDVKHIVILMQENRSFNHYFGTPPGVHGFGDRFLIQLASGKPVWVSGQGLDADPALSPRPRNERRRGGPKRAA
jgi:phospholipase C